MTSDIIVFLVAFFASTLGFFSGFGLGTLLLPAMLLFLPPEVAVAATALVHFANNILKVSLLWKQARTDIVIRFGVPAVIAALAGAWLLTHLALAGGEVTYTLGGRVVSISFIKMVLAGLIFVFALFELWPAFRKLTFSPKYLPAGGLVSGFFGGLSGHQGALRSAFLVKTGIEPQAFIATNAVIGFFVDLARITVYAAALYPALKAGAEFGPEAGLIAFAIAGAFFGVLIGRKYIHKTTTRGLQTLVGLMLLAIAGALGFGFI